MSTDVVYKYNYPLNIRSPYVPGLPARDIREHELFENPEWQEMIDTHVAQGGDVFTKVEPQKKQGKAKSVDSDTEQTTKIDAS